MRLSLRACVLVAALAGLAAPAAAQQVWTAASDRHLDGMRGGFATPSGLMVSFGIARTVRIDGQVVSHTSVRIDDLGRITAQQARQLAQGAAGLTVVQSGTGTRVLTLPGPGLAGLVIQNTQDQRHIQALTVIDAGTNGLGLLQAQNFHRSLMEALQGSLGR